MIALAYGLAALALFWWLSQVFARANPTALAKALKMVGGLVALGGGALMLVRGRIDMALVLGATAAWLFGWSGATLPGARPRAARTAGSVSRVRSAMIEMELDHDTGAMNGTVLAGALAGRALEGLGEPELRALHDACRRADPDGARLLEAYLDRRTPGWREHAEAHADAGARRDAGAMTEEEAYQVLGLQPGAGPDEVRRAHRTLMKKLHPDQGGSTYLAARVNQAKEILLGPHH
jgi:hypothetical protein